MKTEPFDFSKMSHVMRVVGYDLLLGGREAIRMAEEREALGEDTLSGEPAVLTANDRITGQAPKVDAAQNPLDDVEQHNATASYERDALADWYEGGREELQRMETKE